MGKTERESPSTAIPQPAGPHQADRDVQILKQQQAAPQRGLPLSLRIFVYHAARTDSRSVFVPREDGVSCRGVPVPPSVDLRLLPPELAK